MDKIKESLIVLASATLLWLLARLGVIGHI